jgi:hypothetical protein
VRKTVSEYEITESYSLAQDFALRCEVREKAWWLRCIRKPKAELSGYCSLVNKSSEKRAANGLLFTPSLHKIVSELVGA